MKLSRIPAVVALGASSFMVACGALGGSDTVAKAGSNSLSVTRLGEIMASSQAPLEADVARSIAELWLNYQLVGVAAARGDTLTDPKVMDDALWSSIDNTRVRLLYEQVSESWQQNADSSKDEQRYNDGELMSARHILVQVAQDAPEADVQKAQQKAERIRGQATAANFVKLAAQSDEPGAGERGGDLGVFTKGTMVPEFEKAVLDMKPGEISPVIRTAFGFHVIYRKPYSDVRGEVSGQARQRDLAVAESTFLASIEDAGKVKVADNAAELTKNIARNPLGYRKNNSSVATYSGGKLTASRLADWIAAYPPQAQLRPQIINAPDSLIAQFVKQIVRNELLLTKADSAKIQADTAEIANLRMSFRSNLTAAWAALGVTPAELADSAKSAGDREKLAGARIDSYFDKLVKNEVQFADVAYPVARALQNKFSFTLNDASIERAVEKAKALRAAKDSTLTDALAAPDSSTPVPAVTDSTPTP